MQQTRQSLQFSVTRCNVLREAEMIEGELILIVNGRMDLSQNN